MNKIRILYPAAVFAALCVPAARGSLSADTALTGGAFSVPVISALSGGGTASGGALLLSASNLGGPTASGAGLSGGNFFLSGGETAAAAIPLETARADLAAAHCYPVPFRPSAGHTKIFFTGLTRAARIRIYTLSGELTRTLDKSDSGDTLEWDVRNGRGEALASGVYLFVVKSASQTRTGKLVVIR